MSKSRNVVFLTGHVGGEPKVTPLEGGVKVATFSLATSDGGYQNKEGKEIPERTEWHDIVAWRGLAELCEKYVHKGDRIDIEGKLTHRTYTDSNGIERKVTEVVAKDIILPQREKKDGGSYVPAPPQPTIDDMPSNIPNNDDLPF